MKNELITMIFFTILALMLGYTLLEVQFNAIEECLNGCDINNETCISGCTTLLGGNK